jgi:hypothetical protein
MQSGFESGLDDSFSRLDEVLGSMG